MIKIIAQLYVTKTLSYHYQEFNKVAVKCNYYPDTKLNEEISEPIQSTDVLSLCHGDIRSARKKSSGI